MATRTRKDLPKNELANLKVRWDKSISADCLFESLEDFVDWSLQNGYRKGLGLRKHNKKRPHSKKNSYWYDREAFLEDVRRRKEERKAIVAAICRDCKEKGSKVCLNGCVAWQEEFVKNWNEKIYQEPKKQEYVEETGKSVFRYSHPDDIREGRS